MRHVPLCRCGSLGASALGLVLHPPHSSQGPLIATWLMMLLLFLPVRCCGLLARRCEPSVELDVPPNDEGPVAVDLEVSQGRCDKGGPFLGDASRVLVVVLGPLEALQEVTAVVLDHYYVDAVFQTLEPKLREDRRGTHKKDMDWPQERRGTHTRDGTSGPQHTRGRRCGAGTWHRTCD